MDWDHLQREQFSSRNFPQNKKRTLEQGGKKKNINENEVFWPNYAYFEYGKAATSPYRFSCL